MLYVLSKNKSYTSISFEKGVLEAHGIKSWIWDSDGCLWYGEQGAIRCRLVVSSKDFDQAIEILKSDYTQTPDIDQSEESPTSNPESPPYFVLTFSLGLLFILIFGLLDQTTLELPSFIKTITAFLINLFLSGEVFVFSSLGISPAITTELITLINFSLAIIIACMVIGNRILLYIVSIILALIALLASPWVVKSLGMGGCKAVLLLVKNLGVVILVALVSLLVSWGLHLLDFYKSGTGALKNFGMIFVFMVAWPAIISLVIYYTPDFDPFSFFR